MMRRRDLLGYLALAGALPLLDSGPHAVVGELVGHRE